MMAHADVVCGEMMARADVVCGEMMAQADVVYVDLKVRNVVTRFIGSTPYVGSSQFTYT